MMLIREATPDDIDLLHYWDEQPHVIASDPNDDWEWEIELARNPDWREQLIAEVEGKPVGFIQIIDPHGEESHYWGAIDKHLRAIDIWIGEADNMGKGYGTMMMTEALRRCFSETSVTAVLVDPLSSNQLAHRFYEKLGFEFLREQQFGLDHCYVYEIKREKAYLLLPIQITPNQ